MTAIPEGRVSVVGTGPGPERWTTPETAEILAEATDLVGYSVYVDRCPVRPGQVRHGSDNRVELDRARHALELAAAGRHVAVVSGGDPGVFARAIGRPDERVTVTTLATADPALVDMATCVIIGNSDTRVIDRGPGREPWVYSPRSVEDRAPRRVSEDATP